MEEEGEDEVKVELMMDGIISVAWSHVITSTEVSKIRIVGYLYCIVCII